MNKLENRTGIWFVYDGDCPFCCAAALALKIKQEYGSLHLLNARENQDDALIQAVNEQQLDLDEGMVIFTNGRFYHGKQVLQFMAKYGEACGIFNLFNKSLFWSETLASLTYPWMRAVRNWRIRRNNSGRIDNLKLAEQPIFQPIFGDAWAQMPAIMHKHYCNRPYSDDSTVVEGSLDVMCAGPIKLFAPLFWLMGGIPPANERNVPVRVVFQSDRHNKALQFKREFNFRQRKPYRFRSRMIQNKGNEVIELMKYGLGWRMQVIYDDNRVKLLHKGYVLHLFGHFLPLPLTLLLGAGNAEEAAIDENTFAMSVNITHPWWGKIYQYNGQFRIVSMP